MFYINFFGKISLGIFTYNLCDFVKWSCKKVRDYRDTIKPFILKKHFEVCELVYDIDYQLARLLAVQTVTEKPFEKMSDQTFEEAVKLMDSCESVINAGIIIGSANHRIVELLEKAQQDGKLMSL